ncbi:MAG: metal ABC transporter substrate-binding protein [Oscillospiraceae bacterium]|nr:metal ABC transporter substrate-binding protein [Oscillospiraceae bacterium]MDY3218012.1 metal ABC transporter substrate-binding protein [Candidatus Fimivivens sp.]GKH49588.1 periplasmic divalent manganese/zinc-binding lipoprotein [Eubacteriales bacterium]GKH62229.1 periplasmic divalent manganese/zinc-binding lipoprotein [Eubacteriales bacterium]SFI62346.1 zinc transport system substrate-binding protein [Ruminococcaceae bacterium D5]
MKRILAALCAAALLALTGCAPAPASSSPAGKEKLTVYATLFPQYDFAREIAGDRAEVILLLPPGVESHSFEPTPADIAGISKSDLLLYTGDAMEPWAAKLIAGDLPDTVRAVDLSQGVALLAEEHEEEGHAHPFDPHIWTSPVNAMIMARTVVSALCEADPEGAEAYRANGERYLAELESLDDEIRTIVSQAKRRELVFGGRFAFHYFTAEYGLTAYSAYDSCSEETEPSAKAVSEVIGRVREDHLPVVYYEELTEPKVARSIAQETGAKLLLLHSCHNLSKDELAAGESYLSLMKQNAQNLREGLN